MATLGTAITTVILLIVVAFFALGAPTINPTRSLNTTSLFEMIRLVFYVVAGLGGVVALVMTYRRQRSTERAQDHTEKVARISQAHAERLADDDREDAIQRRVTEMYTSAVDQLGNQNAAVRLGGLYLLERLGQDHEQQRQTIINMICAYLRMPFTLPDAIPTEVSDVEAEEDLHIDLTHADEAYQELQVRLTAQRIIATHLRVVGDASPPTYWPGMQIDLVRSTLVDADFSFCNFDNTNFTEARFHGQANFTEARFHGRANFTAALFERYATFKLAAFDKNALFEALKARADMIFGGTRFKMNATFANARFTGGVGIGSTKFFGFAEFRDAQFHGPAMLSATQFRRGGNFDRISFDSDARFDGTSFSWVPAFKDTVFRKLPDFEDAIFPEIHRRWDEGEIDWRIGPSPEDPGTYRVEFQPGRPPFSYDSILQSSDLAD